MRVILVRVEQGDHHDLRRECCHGLGHACRLVGRERMRDAASGTAFAYRHDRRRRYQRWWMMDGEIVETRTVLTPQFEKIRRARRGA